MIEATIDLDLLDENEENSFDKLMSAYEKLSLEKPDIITNVFEKRILSLERKIQDLSESKDDVSAAIVNRTMEILKAYSAIIDNDISVSSIDLVGKSLESLSDAVTNSYKSIQEINFEFDVLSPIKYLKNRDIKKITITQLIQATSSSYMEHNLHHSLIALQPSNQKFTSSQRFIDTWELQMKFGTDKDSHHKPLEFIYQFIELLNRIDGVKVVLEDITIGSVVAKLKMYFKSEKGKDDVKDVLESSRKFAIGKLEKDYEETQKSKAETDKINAERLLLEKKIKDEDSIENDYLKSLNIQNAEEDLKKKQLENKLLELKLLSEVKNTYTELLAAGFISQNDFQLFIKGLPFLKINNGRFEIGESTQVIDDL